MGKDAGPRRSYSQSSYDDDDGRRGAAVRDRRVRDDDRDRESLRGKVRDSVRDSRDRDMDDGGNRRRYAGGDDDYDDNDVRGRNRSQIRDRDNGRDNGRDDGRDRDDWVPLQKYDELQNLCDQLMRQQEVRTYALLFNIFRLLVTSHSAILANYSVIIQRFAFVI